MGEGQGRALTQAAFNFATASTNWPTVSITTDKLGSYPKAIRHLQRDGRLSDDVTHQTSKYLNNTIKADHGALKQLIRPARGSRR